MERTLASLCCNRLHHGLESVGHVCVAGGDEALRCSLGARRTASRLGGGRGTLRHCAGTGGAEGCGGGADEQQQRGAWGGAKGMGAEQRFYIFSEKSGANAAVCGQDRLPIKLCVTDSQR
jgi:hypothetical protein